MMLESIIAAYTLSALTLNNARSSERQMMASSWLIMTAAVSFSYAAPLDQMHPLRPLKSLFHPAIFFSIFGQALIHIACMTLGMVPLLLQIRYQFRPFFTLISYFLSTQKPTFTHFITHSPSHFTSRTMGD